MPSNAGTAELLALLLGRALEPLKDRLQSGQVLDLFTELGISFPPAITAQANLSTALQSASTAAAALPGLIGGLATAIEAEDVGQIVFNALNLINTARSLFEAIDDLATEIPAAAVASGFDAGDAAAFAAEFAERLLDYLLVRYLEANAAVTLNVLNLLGFIDRTPIPPVPPRKPGHIERRVRFDRIGSFFSNPEDILRNAFGWGDPGFDGREFLRRLSDFFDAISLPAHLDAAATPPKLDLFLFNITPKTDISPPGLAVTVHADLGVLGGVEVPVGPGLAINAALRADLQGGGGLVFAPPARVTLIPVTGSFQGEVSIGAARTPRPGRDSIVLVGVPGGSGLHAQRIAARIFVTLVWDVATAQARADFGFAGEISGGKLKVSLENADGFLGTILSGFGLEADFDFGFGWRAGGGIFFTGSSTLEIQLPAHIALGPVEINALTLTIGIENRAFPIGLAADIKAALGPLQAVIQQIGVRADLTLPANHRGKLGPVDFALDFKPPNGVGLSIDAGVIRGGGFLFIDTARGEYAGALELTFSEIVSLKAIGLITTRMPDGSDGFSLLIIITADFGAGFQLGFGFTLLAVGGLLGLNRTMKLQPLMDGIRTGSIESIMFPQDVVANAPRIISDLRIIFPPLEGKFLIGPMAKLGWGTPTLISISLGIIIEIPGNLAILGILKIAIPADEIALIILQVNFAGAIEFDRKRLYFFAALFESRIVFLTIEGEMGLLVAFGDDANFVVSVGGFHPRFNPPPLPFPSPRRISVSLLNTPVSRLRIEGYFAVTSNTVQFGARVEVFFGLDEINVQGHLAFDALFQFSPFFFIIEISASFSVNVFGIGLFSVSVRGSLDGPAPYHVKGHGSISFLFFDVDVDFETTWGESRNTELPPIPVMPILQGEINKPDNWRALLPPSNNLLVSLRQMPAEEAEMILHPLGVLHISQRALPLELKLDKVGTQKPNDVNRLSVVVTGGGLAKRDDVFEQFAPAQFQNFSDADKLSRPAFAPEKSGLNLSAAGADTRSSRMVKRIVRYEEIIIDNNFRRFQRRFAGYFGSLFAHFLAGNAVSRSAVSRATRLSLQPFADTVDVTSETYTVAFQSNNTAVAADAVSFHSEASARDYMDRQIAADASLADEIHVIPSFEMAA